jgi:hypothetical protein
VTNSAHPGQQRIEEFCMLSAIGELPLEDTHELDRHLARCPDCRGRLSDFQRMGLEDLPLVAASRTEEKPFPVLEDSEVENALNRVLRLSEKTSGGRQNLILPMPPLQTAPRKAVVNWRNKVMYAAASIGLLFGAAASYHFYLLHEQDIQHSNLATTLEVEHWKLQTKSATAQHLATEAALGQMRKNAEAAQASLLKEQAQNADLLQKQKTLEERIAADIAAYSSQSHELQVARASLAQDQDSQRAMALEIQDLKAHSKKQSSEALAATEAHSMPAEPAARQETNMTTSEAKDLLGARDLHIVDVFDETPTGNTRKIYGRVYYVNRRYLLFYAFDLQVLKNKHAAAAFQAWGFRDPNSLKPESLGMFYMDDASLNRWALKITNTAVLSRIDTVFVTLEPSGGSSTPNGKKLLFASLTGPPNHP